MDAPAGRYRKLVAGAAVIGTVALAVVVGQIGTTDRQTAAVASIAPTGSVRSTPRPPVLSSGSPVAPPDTPVPLPGEAAPSEAPSEGLTQTFLSIRYRFSISYPFGWRPEHAAHEYDADTLTAPAPSTTRLSMIRRARTPGLKFEREAEAWLPPRHAPTGGCRWNSSGLIYVPGGDTFHDVTIDGHPAVVRSECSVVDAAVDLGDEAMIFVLRSQRHMPTGDRATFDQLMASVAITMVRKGPIETPRPLGALPPTGAQPSPTPQPTQAAMFVSLRFGYAIAYPAEWTVTEIEDGLVRDELSGPGAQRLTLRTVAKPRTTSAQAWAEANLATRVTVSDPASTGCHWPGGTVFIPRSPASFVRTTRGGRPAAVRSECGYVDGVVDLGDRVLLLSLHITAHRKDGDRGTFDELMSGLHILGRT